MVTLYLMGQVKQVITSNRHSHKHFSTAGEPCQQYCFNLLQPGVLVTLTFSSCTPDFDISN